MTYNLPLLLRSFAACAVLSAMGVSGSFLNAAEPVEDNSKPTAAQLEFFEAKIRPVLIKHCYECHSEESKNLQANLYVDTREGLLEGGDSGEAIVPGNVEDSFLMETLHYGEDTYQMPPKGKLPDTVIADFEKWIRMGAADPRNREGERKSNSINIEEGKKFWSFQPPKRTPQPEVSNQSWVKQPLDAFVLAKIDEAGLVPAQPAEKRTLIRRAYLDLIGIPPTPEQITKFLEDDSSTAFEKVVDELLASPLYGERWGRHWLDVARYAEDNTNMGPHNGPYKHAWRYRDWVINALNEDVPYDQFLIRQLATDFLPETGPDDLPALGFLGLGPQNHKEVALAQVVLQNRFADDWEDRVDLVGRGLQGLTMACARCHDHKYDPITTKDYYGLASVFASVRQTTRPIITKEEIAKTQPARDLVAKHNKEIKELQATIKKLVAKIKKAEANSKTALNTEKSELDKKLKLLQAEVKKIKSSTAGFEIPVANSLTEETIRVEEITPEKMKLAYYANKPRDLNIYIRGDAGNLGEPVARRFLEVLENEGPVLLKNGSGRLELAQLIASKVNPLTARVIVNRIWRQHFGEGLVDTPSNFGQLGSKPTHPELLDDLAVRFMEQGWSLKRLHREIMLSSTYQQSSVSQNSVEAQATDPANRLLSFFNRRRLEVEPYRDSLLAVSGLLDEKMGGPSVDPTDAENKRRTVYSEISRHKLNDLLGAFDFPDPGLHSAARSETTTPQQQLFVMNSPFIKKQVEAFSKRIVSMAGDDSRQRIEEAYELLYGRLPNVEEIEIGLRYIEMLDKRRERDLPIDEAPPLFAGNRMKVDIPELSETYTIEMLVWNDVPNEKRPITGYFFSRGEEGLDRCPGDHLGIGGNYKGSANKGKLIFYNGDRKREALFGKTVIQPKTWNHIALVREGKNVTVYLNGNPEPEIQGEVEPGYANNVRTLLIGGRSDNFANLNGRLTDIVVYNRTITPEEVVSHCDLSGFNENQKEQAVQYEQVVLKSNPAAYFPLRKDHPRSKQARDITSFENHGVYEGREGIDELSDISWQRYFHALLSSNEMLYYD